MTSPPCAGNTVWFVSSEKLELSSTIIAMF